MKIHIMRSTRCVLLFGAALPAFGATSISSIESTQTQAKITVQTDQTGFCTYRASRGTAFSISIPDLVDNANTDARSGSIVNAGTHVFILGTRKANDALAAGAAYWLGVTCGADSEVSAVFMTRPIQWGNTAPDIVPFNSSKFGNMDHPAIDFNNSAAANTFCDPSTHSYCDPNTGTEYWVATKPGWAAQSAVYPAAYSGTWYGTPIDVTGGKWATPNNVASNGSSFSVGSGGPSDQIFIPLNSFGCPSGGNMQAFGGKCTIDDLIFDVYCGNAAISGMTLTLQLARYTGSTPTVIGNSITTSACPTATPIKVGSYPNAGDPTKVVAQPLFKGWGLTGIQNNHIIPPNGNNMVIVSGTAVTLGGSPAWQNYFDLDWAAGQPIWINNSYAHLATAPTTSTALTLEENLGTLTNVSYTGVELGLVITKSNNGSNVSVSVGLNYAYSEMPSHCCNGDIPMFNLASVSVSKSADGVTCGIYTVGCSAGTLNPPLTGNIGWVQASSTFDAVLLWIPRNADGSPRGETRLLSILSKPSGSARTVGNGDTLSSIGLSGTLFFDNQNGNNIYGTDQGGKRIWKLNYNESYTGCPGYVSYHPYPASGDYNDSNHAVSDDCFTYTVLTPLTPQKDVKSQVMGTDGHSGAYQTGLNYLGQSIGTAHPGFDLGWMGCCSPAVGGAFIGFDGGFLTLSLGTFQNGLGIVATLADDGTGLLVLKSLRNTWNEGALRWGGLHTCPVTDMGTYRFCSIDPLDNGPSSTVFHGRNQATVSQVNRAGFGSATVWDSSTTLTSNTDFFTCPTLPAPFASLSGTQNCVQVRVNTPFCQITPNSTYTFPDGKTEKDEFPCTTPGFGLANAAYSKLQDVQAGDWLMAGDSGVFGERFVIATAPVYNSATDITFWLLRTAGYLYTFPAYGGGDETNGSGHSSSGQSCCTHGGAWYLWTAPSGGGNANATGAASAVIDVSSPSNNWLLDNPIRFSAHGSAGAGASPGTYSYSQAGCGTGFNWNCGTSSLTPAASVNIPLSNNATSAPSFAGTVDPTAVNWLQTYANASYLAGSSAIPFFVDFRAINTSSLGAETPTSIGNSTTFTPVGAPATKTYVVSGDAFAGSTNYKAWGLQGYAGRFWMKDVSSPTTFSSLGDMADWSVCQARNNNECVFGSMPGKLYMTAPKADIQSRCWSSNFGAAVPCVSSFGPVSGQTVQFRIDRLDPAGLGYRKFGFAHAHLGVHYPFSNCRVTPDPQFMFCPGFWLDGVRTEWLAFRIGALPPVDNVNRTTFVPVSLTYQGVPFASNIRARFGYAENGGDLLYCTAYGQDCSTELPSGSPNDPFSFTNEAVTRQTCANGANCTVTIPSLPNRVLYYVVDRLDASGGVLETSPLQAVVVP